MARRYSRYGNGYGYSRRRRERRREERSFEAITFGVIILIILLGLFYPIDGVFLALLGGAVLIGSGIYQNSRRWRVNPITWFGGAAMLLVAFMGYYTGAKTGPLLPLIIMVGVLAASFFTGEL